MSNIYAKTAQPGTIKRVTSMPVSTLINYPIAIIFSSIHKEKAWAAEDKTGIWNVINCDHVTDNVERIGIEKIWIS